MNMEAKVHAIQDICLESPGRVFFGWRGIAPEVDSFYKINLVFCYAVFEYNGVVAARKIAGTSEWFRDGEQKIIYSTDLYRIKDGPRCKKVILPDDILANESVYPAGLIKNVEIGVLPYQLTEARRSDILLVDMVYDIVSREPVKADRIERPVVYLTSYDKKDYTPRLSNELINTLKNSTKYCEKHGIQDNFYTCFEDCFERRLPNRWFVNYEWVKGKGIPYLDLDTVHPSFAIDSSPEQIDFEDQHFIFRMSGSLKNIRIKNGTGKGDRADRGAF